MALPQSVQRQGARSDELLAHLIPVQATDTPAPAPTPVVTPAPEPAPTPIPAPVLAQPATEPVPDPNQGRVDWKQKFLVIDGKYRAEVPRLTSQAREAYAKVTELQAKNLELHEELAQLRKAPPQHHAASTTDPDIDPTLLSAIDRRAASAARGEATRIVTERVAPIETRVAANEASADDKSLQEFFSAVNDLLLDSHNASWQPIDELPDFKRYLADPDPFSGVQRQQLLTTAVQHRDAARAVRFFQDFLDRTTSRPAPSVPTPIPAPTPTPDPRAALVAPERSTAGAPLTEPTKRFYSPKDVSDFYVTLSKASANRNLPAAERERLQAIDMDIQLAQREGRIRAR